MGKLLVSFSSVHTVRFVQRHIDGGCQKVDSLLYEVSKAN